MNKTTKIFALGMSMCLGFTTQVIAQDETGNLSSNWAMTPKNLVDGRAFEEAMMEHIKFRASKGDPRDWDVYQVAVGDDMGMYFVRTCCFDWADQDTYNAWSAESGATDHFYETVGPHISEISHSMSQIDMENSNWGEVEYRYVGVTNFTTVPGKQQQMNEAKATMSQLALEHGWSRNWVWGSDMGGASSSFIASPYTSFADMAPPEVSFMEFASEHMGEEEAAAVMQSYNETIQSSSYTIYRLRSDLSAD